MVTIKTIFILGLTLVITVSCSGSGDVYTFYRNSLLDPSKRIHVATFDSKAGMPSNPDYNRLSCEETAMLYNKNDPSGQVWWCEKGKYRE